MDYKSRETMSTQKRTKIAHDMIKSNKIELESTKSKQQTSETRFEPIDLSQSAPIKVKLNCNKAHQRQSKVVLVASDLRKSTSRSFRVLDRDRLSVT